MDESRDAERRCDVGQHSAVLLLCCGSVATIKVPALVALLHTRGHHVALVASHASLHFLQSESAGNGILSSSQSIPNEGTVARQSPWDSLAHLASYWLRGAPVFVDDDEWRCWRRKGDPVLHIELRRIASIACIAPLDANTLAKLASGLCDNLLTCVMRAWDVENAPVVVAPAMNTLMWQHPVTAAHLTTLRSWYKRIVVVDPVSQMLACGDCGVGALAPVDVIAEAVCQSCA